MNQDNYSSTVQSRTRDIDVGLKSHMQSVYNRMTLGVLVTALVAYAISNSAALMQLFMGGPQAYLFMFAPLAVLWFGFRPERMSSKQLSIGFFAIAALYGVSFSVIALIYSGESIARAFFMTVALFAGLSIFGYTTKKNLDGLGTFAIMGVWSVFILSIGTMIAGKFFGVETSKMQLVISGVSLLAFSGITAWQTQATKEMYQPGAGKEGNSRMAWSAALTLYISFVAMFQSILNLMGRN